LDHRQAAEKAAQRLLRALRYSRTAVTLNLHRWRGARRYVGIDPVGLFTFAVSFGAQRRGGVFLAPRRRRARDAVTLVYSLRRERRRQRSNAAIYAAAISASDHG
jgi:hypothetical protein